jgi:FkbM family methyltransferase
MNQIIKDFFKRILTSSNRSGCTSESFNPIADIFWFDHPNYWEPNVTVAIRDTLQVGATFWDVGANVGGITRLASRLVGPNGKVLAIEASLDNFRKLNRNILLNGLNNVFSIKAVIWNQAGETVNLYHGTGGDDSLLHNASLTNGSEQVITTTLDEMYKAFGMPDVIKLDIEGVEEEAIRGASEITKLKDGIKRPIFLLEQGNENFSALDLLLKKDYAIQDLSTGSIHLSTPHNYEESISNWLAIPQEAISDFGFLLKPFDNDVFANLDEDSGFTIEKLECGRYKVEISIEPRYHGKAQWLQQSYKFRQFDFTKAEEFKVSIESPTHNPVVKSKLKSVKVYEKDNFPVNYFSYLLAP